MVKGHKFCFYEIFEDELVKRVNRKTFRNKSTKDVAFISGILKIKNQQQENKIRQCVPVKEKAEQRSQQIKKWIRWISNCHI